MPGQVGRYQVRERLGEGGMGVLYLALDPAIDRLVAIKVLRVSDGELRGRFIREAQSAGRLQHPNIVTIFDVGEYDGQPFIAMEYIAGETLSELIQRRAPLTVDRKLALMKDLCDGLHYAHRAGIVHRDVKPMNVMVNRDGALKVLDFGIARLSDSSLTHLGVVMGTPSYMAPEQISNARVDHRADIFAVGAVFYELLAGRRAFDDESQYVILNRVLHEEPAPLSTIVPGLSREVIQIVARAMQKSPDARYQDLEAMAAGIAVVRNQLSGAAGGRPLFPPDTPRPSGTPTPGGRLPAREDLIRLRLEQTERHLRAARDAFARADLDEALHCANEAAVLDPDHAGTLALLAEIRAAMDERARTALLDAADQCLESGDLTNAHQLVVEASALGPSERTRDVRARLDSAVASRDAQREREQRHRKALAHGRDSLAAGALDSAIRAADEALAYVPSSAAARDLRAEAQHRIAARQAADESSDEETLVLERERKGRRIRTPDVAPPPAAAGATSPAVPATSPGVPELSPDRAWNQPAARWAALLLVGAVLGGAVYTWYPRTPSEPIAGPVTAPPVQPETRPAAGPSGDVPAGAGKAQALLDQSRVALGRGALSEALSLALQARLEQPDLAAANAGVSAVVDAARSSARQARQAAAGVTGSAESTAFRGAQAAEALADGAGASNAETAVAKYLEAQRDYTRAAQEARLAATRATDGARERDEWVNTRLALARDQIARQQWQDAAQTYSEIRARAPQTPGLDLLTTQLNMLRSTAESLQWTTRQVAAVEQAIDKGQWAEAERLNEELRQKGRSEESTRFAERIARGKVVRVEAPVPPASGIDAPRASNEVPAVEAVVRVFGRGYSDKNLGEMRRAWPSMPANVNDSYERAFRTNRWQSWEFDRIVISIEGATATASTEVRVSQQSIRERQPQTERRRYQMTLRRSAGGWQIEAMQFQGTY